jgi:tRNA pseudouridine38-40 synthase
VKNGNSTRRIVSESFVVRDSNFVIFTIVANAFLHQQIRRISSLLMQIGLGKKTPEDVKYYLASKIRGEFVQVSKAKGLCLKKVKYSHNWSSIFRAHPSLLDSKI